jgi:hypothetical protein
VFRQCVTCTEYEISTAADKVSVVFSLGTVDDARENKSEWRLMPYICQQLKAFVIRLALLLFSIAELCSVLLLYKICKEINLFLLFIVTIK